MLIAALAHAGRREGVDVEGAVAEAVEQLGLGCSISFTDTDRGGLASVHARVATDDTSHPPAALLEAIDRTHTSERVKAQAAAAVHLLVGAEAQVHGVEPGVVHLHELGSADTAADAIGAAVALEVLGVSSVAAAPVPVPRGWISSAHGPLPVPAPATLELLSGVRLVGVDDEGELMTPTAVAILKAHDCVFGPPPGMTLRSTGVGAGSAHRDRPNVCRVLLGDPSTGPDGLALERVVLLETNIDDQTPEGVGHAVEKLMSAGALDAWVTPVVMKKSRPALALSVLVRPAQEAEILDAIFRETTTLGVRRRETERWVLQREELCVPVHGVKVRVKVARLRGQVVNVAPEFDDCVAASEQCGIAVKEIHALAADAARRTLAALD